MALDLGPSQPAEPAVERRKRYERLRSALTLERSSFEAHWRDIATYLFPVRPRFTLSDKNRGDRRSSYIIDSTATFALHTLGSGLHAGLTSPARPWMKLTTPDPGLTKIPAVKAWLFDVTERMHAVFQLSNLYTALPVLYEDLGAFGTGAMAVLEDPGGPGRSADLLRCFTFPPGSYALGVDTRGLANCFAREMRWTVGQVVEEFGAEGEPLDRHGQAVDWGRFSPSVKTAWERGDYQNPIDLVWMVLPAREGESGAFPWRSCHYEVSGPPDRFLRESGFWEFPILAPRWTVNMEDTYGTDCPAMTALGDIKQLQMQQKRKSQAIEKLINPPLSGPEVLRTQKVSLLPGDMTYVDQREGQTGLRPIHEVRPDVSALVGDLQETQMRINRAFYVDLFQMLATMDAFGGAQRPTAREVQERHEEKLLILGPVLMRTADELHDPLIDRTFAMMERAGLIPPAPSELEGVELTVEYTSVLAQAQKLVDVVAQDRYLTTAVGLAPLFPEVVHKINIDAVLERYADRLGVDPAFTRPAEEVAERMAAQAQAAQEAAAAETLATQAKAAQHLAQTPMEGDTALRRIVEGIQGP